MTARIADAEVRTVVELVAHAVGARPDVAPLTERVERVVAHLPSVERDTTLAEAFRSVRPVTETLLRDRGLDAPDVAASTADVDRKLDRYGVRGTGVGWFLSVLTARVVAVGRLQFETGGRASDGVPVWDVHVPEGGPLDPAAVDDAFSRAPSVLRGVNPEDTVDRWRCRSWLLDPWLTAALGPHANVVRFAARFRLGPDAPEDPDEGDRDVAKFVFGTDLSTARTLTPTSRLQRAVRDRWAAGGHWSTRTGCAPVEVLGVPSRP